ncbi:MAG TPA: chemotaxis protein CheD [Gemmatimonadales bacterium]|nr:chemotaxis protein CheD [Gemmatimonadales bacterium]
MSGREILVRVADLRTAAGGERLLTVGLGSCVAVVLHDPVAKVGGMAHVLLPSPALSRNDGNPGRFPQTAVPRLLELMTEAGAAPSRITARLAGGASMFASLAAPGTIQMGERNVVACRQVLSEHELPVVGEAVGGDFGRTVRLDTATGAVEVMSVAHGVQQL